jgi:small subunit ribosomal protein S19
MVYETKKFQYKGHELDKLRDMDIKEFSKVTTARIRRSINRGFTEAQKLLLEKVKIAKAQLIAGKEPKLLKTHCRDMVILPIMVGLKFGIYNGRDFVTVEIKPDMLGHVLGEFTYNRKRVEHHSPGVGATRGSSFVATK